MWYVNIHFAAPPVHGRVASIGLVHGRVASIGLAHGRVASIGLAHGVRAASIGLAHGVRAALIGLVALAGAHIGTHQAHSAPLSCKPYRNRADFRLRADAHIRTEQADA